MEDSVDLEEVRRAFNQCGKDNDGRVEKNELARLVRRLTGDFELAGDISSFENAQLTWPQVMALVGPGSGAAVTTPSTAATVSTAHAAAAAGGGGLSSGLGSQLLDDDEESPPRSRAPGRSGGTSERTRVSLFGDDSPPHGGGGNTSFRNSAGGGGGAGSRAKPRALAKALGSGWDSFESDSDEDGGGGGGSEAPPARQLHPAASATRQHAHPQLLPTQATAAAYAVPGGADPGRRKSREDAAGAGNGSSRRANSADEDDSDIGGGDDQSASFRTGDRVAVALARGGSQHGTVVAANPDGSYRVELDNGTLRRFVEASSLRLDSSNGGGGSGGGGDPHGNVVGRQSAQNRRRRPSEEEESSSDEEENSGDRRHARPRAGSGGSGGGGGNSSDADKSAPDAPLRSPGNTVAEQSNPSGPVAASPSRSSAEADAAAAKSFEGRGSGSGSDGDNSGGAGPEERSRFGGGGGGGGGGGKKHVPGVGLLKEMFQRRSLSRDRKKKHNNSGGGNSDGSSPDSSSSSKRRSSGSTPRSASGTISRALAWRPSGLSASGGPRTSRSHGRGGGSGEEGGSARGSTEGASPTPVAEPAATAGAASKAATSSSSSSSSSSEDEADEQKAPASAAPPSIAEGGGAATGSDGRRGTLTRSGSAAAAAAAATATTPESTAAATPEGAAAAASPSTPGRRRFFGGGGRGNSSSRGSSPAGTPARRGSGIMFLGRRRSNSGDPSSDGPPAVRSEPSEAAAEASAAAAGSAGRASSASPRRLPWGLSSMRSMGGSVGRRRSGSKNGSKDDGSGRASANLASTAPVAASRGRSPAATADGPARRRGSARSTAWGTPPPSAAATRVSTAAGAGGGRGGSTTTAAETPRSDSGYSGAAGRDRGKVGRRLQTDDLGSPLASPALSPGSGEAGDFGDDDSWVGFEGEEDEGGGDSASEFAGGENAEEDAEFSYDGFFGSMAPGSPATGAGQQHAAGALPDAVERYIGARGRLERRLSASGPAKDPDEAVLAPRVDESTVAGILRGLGLTGNGAGVMVARGVASAAQRTEQTLPFTEAMFKAGVSETALATKQGNLLEGYLSKYSPGGLKGVRWHRRYFVLYAGASAAGAMAGNELRYYKGSAAAAWGVIPLGERGAVPLRLVTRIEQPSQAKWKGRRFDLVVRYRGEGRYPGCHIRPGQEHEVLTTKTFKFRAEDAQQRLLWVTVIEALMRRHGWGAAPQLPAAAAAAAARRRTSAAAADGATAVRSPHRRALSWRDQPGYAPGHGAGMEPLAGGFDGNSGYAGDTGNKEVSSPVGGTGRKAGIASYPRQGPTASDQTGAIASGTSSRQMGGKLKDTDRGSSRGGLRLDESFESSGSAAAKNISAALTIPFSPAGRRGSLTTRALTPPVPLIYERSYRSAPPLGQSSLRSDLSAR